ncbi:protein MAIN-LIKE 1-like [Glycine soja]|uniref:protein MAIN-LIKE 1-like n=1 Tax=Glycine soja TaxID=3848 RepID=UPI00103D5909|nr:protein MAIN-LIKE 1-like [Glycine soja]
MSSFHLPVREMVITLDDVSYLLHFPMTCRPIDHVLSLFDKEAVKILLMSHLGLLIETEASAATNTGVRVRLMWQEDLYHYYVESDSYVWIVTTYLLYLLSSTIFGDKSSTHVHVTNAHYINKLDACHEYAWGVTAMAYLYDHLAYASKYSSK